MLMYINISEKQFCSLCPKGIVKTKRKKEDKYIQYSRNMLYYSRRKGK